MSFDERELGALITESQDLQSEARVQARESLPMLEEWRHERGDVRPGPEERRAFDASRRSLLARLGGNLLGHRRELLHRGRERRERRRPFNWLHHSAAVG